MRPLLAPVLLAAVASMAVCTVRSVGRRDVDWLAWKRFHAKAYQPSEEAFRFAQWSANMAFIDAHNARRAEGPRIVLKMNALGDLNHSEYASMLLTPRWRESTPPTVDHDNARVHAHPSRRRRQQPSLPARYVHKQRIP